MDVVWADLVPKAAVRTGRRMAQDGVLMDFDRWQPCLGLTRLDKSLY